MAVNPFSVKHIDLSQSIEAAREFGINEINGGVGISNPDSLRQLLDNLGVVSSDNAIVKSSDTLELPLNVLSKRGSLIVLEPNHWVVYSGVRTLDGINLQVGRFDPQNTFVKCEWINLDEVRKYLLTDRSSKFFPDYIPVWGSNFRPKN